MAALSRLGRAKAGERDIGAGDPGGEAVHPPLERPHLRGPLPDLLSRLSQLPPGVVELVLGGRELRPDSRRQAQQKQGGECCRQGTASA